MILMTHPDLKIEVSPMVEMLRVKTPLSTLWGPWEDHPKVYQIKFFVFKPATPSDALGYLQVIFC